MPANAAIVLADGQATPVNHTFSPTRISGDVAFYEDRSGGIPAGFSSLSLSLRNGPVIRRGVAKLEVPVLDPLTGAVILTTGVDVTFRLPVKGTTAQRADVLAYTKNLMAHAISGSLFRDLEFFW